MTLAECRTQARELGRLDTTAATDVRMNQLIQNAVDEFANDVSGFAKDDYPVIAATFDTATHFAIRVTITGGTNALTATDVAITTTARTDASGSTVASDFQATLRTAVGGGANITVAWADFAFTVDTIDGTSITFAEPSDPNYADARDLLGLTGTTTEAAADHTGNFPENATMRYTLPASLISLERVEWNGYPLQQIDPIASPETSGTPYQYFVRGRELNLVPSPNEQGLCHVWYRGAPTAIDFDVDTDLPSEIPSTFHMAIPHLVAYYGLLQQFDDKLAGMRRAEYQKLMRQFRVERQNMQTVIHGAGPDDRHWYRVDLT